MKLKPKSFCKNGAKRTIRKFLLFPLQIEDDRRWLEFVNILQERNEHYGNYDDYEYKKWDNIKFIEKDEVKK